MEHGDIPEKLIDPCNSNVQHDSDLIRLLAIEDMDDKSKSMHGWRAVTWSRTISSSCWFKECTLGVDDILVDESVHQSGLRGEIVGKFQFRDLYSVFPTFSIDNGDILCLKSAVEPSDPKGWVVAVDLGKKTVKALGAFPFENRHPTMQGFRMSTLSCHLAITPGIRVSAYHKITQAGGSANNPQNAVICVDKHVYKPVSWQVMSEELQRLMREEPKSIKDESQSSMQNDQSSMKQQRLLAEKITPPLNKAPSIVQNDLVSLDRPVQSNREKLEKLKRIWHESQSSMQDGQSRMKQQRLLAEKITPPLNKDPSIVQNDHVSQVHPVHNNREKLEKLKHTWPESQSSKQNDQSRMEQQRPLAEKITLPLNKDPSIVQNDHISQVHPVQNDLPPQQCFNRWDQRMLPGQSYFPQQNDLVCFNMLYGFRGYTPMVNTPVHGYGNYQPPWHQPPLWSQQQPSSKFESHKASCFNNHNGASYHGYVQQLPADTHSVYGNNQQQWQSLPPIYNLPARGSWLHPPPVQHQCQSSGVWT